MGLDSSRQVSLPENINDADVRADIIKGFNADLILNSALNSNQIEKAATLSNKALLSAGVHMARYFKKRTLERSSKRLRLLEIMAGNCVASSILYNCFCFSHCCQEIPLWIATDICQYTRSDESKFLIQFHQLNSVDAVSKFGSTSNILLLVSPMPALGHHKTACWAYADYYACHDFIEQESDVPNRYIVFIGELGASDGTAGMYRYLNEHKKLHLDYRETIQSGTDALFGPCIKEIFIYQLTRE